MDMDVCMYVRIYLYVYVCIQYVFSVFMYSIFNIMLISTHEGAAHTRESMFCWEHEQFHVNVPNNCELRQIVPARLEHLALTSIKQQTWSTFALSRHRGDITDQFVRCWQELQWSPSVEGTASQGQVQPQGHQARQQEAPRPVVLKV
jgi:hypothetical protein